jgi:hypothetical protein
MTPFFDAMELHLRHRRWDADGAESQMKLYVRTRLQHSPPFVKCPPGFIRDLHEYGLDGPLVPCAQIEALLENLTSLLIDYGTSFVEIIGPGKKMREFEQARSVILRAAEVFSPRNQRLRKRFQDVIDTLQQKIGGNYARLESHQREYEKVWREGLAHCMTVAFQAFAPPRADYPNEAVYFAIASIYDELNIEHGNMKLGNWRSLAERIRKRCEARRTLD